jgi:hypothetical protein
MNTWQSWARRGVLMAMVAGMAALTGCAGIKVIDPNVRSFGTAPADLPRTFQFERLPSQDAQADQAARMESQAEPALLAAGFRKADDAAYSIQVHARRSAVLTDPWEPWPGYRARFWAGFGPRPLMFNWRWTSSWDSASNLYEVAVVIRDRKQNKVVYESRAEFDVRVDNDRYWTPMFQAVLADFPQGKPDVHPVQVTLPPQP